jgi:hypothetical protein
VTGVIARLPSRLRPALETVAQAPPAAVPELRRRLELHLTTIEELAEDDGFIDVSTARAVAARCRRLLDAVPPSNEEHAALVQLAVSYFILDPDADGDVGSITGFDDDALVVEAVAQAIGRADLLAIDSVAT